MKSQAPSILIAANCAMFLPAILTARASFRSLAPAQSEQATVRAYESSLGPTSSDAASATRLLRVGITPSNRRDLLPHRMASLAFGEREPNGAVRSKRYRSVRRWSRSSVARPLGTPQGAIAPSAMDRFVSGTTLSGSISVLVPIPLQAGQAPYGLLNENRRGVSSSKPDVAVSADELRGKAQLTVFEDIQDDDTAREGQRGFQRVGQPAFNFRTNDQTVDNRVDGVRSHRIQTNLFVQCTVVPVDSHAHISVVPQAFQLLVQTTLPVSYPWRQNPQPRTVGPGEHGCRRSRRRSDRQWGRRSSGNVADRHGRRGP